ncbi:MAG: SpoIIE family protein phosphatase [Ruminiclostridium sp.]|nr:SpoIIE family protein phosphatase [Ruminiclostridium sp.]
MINGKKAIAICTSRIWDNQHHSFLEQLNKNLIPHDCRLLIYTINSDLYWEESDNVPECYVFDIIPYDRIDCLILMDEKIKSRKVSNRIISKAEEFSVPVIVVDGTYENTVNVSFDYEQGFESVVRHAIEHHGVKKPHFMAGIRNNKFSDARIDIFKKVLAENNMPFDDSMVSYGEFWAWPARNSTQKLIDDGNIPDAVICANDIMAINVADVFIKAGIGVPEQVIVTGFDGIEESLVSVPPISTAGCDSIELAESVGKAVMAIINGEHIADISVVPKLIPNTSCGCEYESPSSNPTLDTINSGFYRYQDDVRVFHNIAADIQQASSPEEAAEFMNNPLLHDLCCIMDKHCFDSGRNYFDGKETENIPCVFFDSYHTDKFVYPLEKDEFVPDLEKRFESGHPLIFNAIDLMGKPFGYLCFSFVGYEITDYVKTASVTNTISIGLGGYINMRYQKYLTEKVTAELKVAAQMQMNMLPMNHAHHVQYEISASMIPAKNVGGDFYDFFHIDNDHLGLIMADVSGKGVPAALFMAISKLIIHDRAMLPGTPAEILQDVNKHICENNKMDLFITMWFGILDLKTGIVTYANAGHEYPAVKLGDGKYELVGNNGDNFPPVGVSDDMVYEDHTIDLSKGGSLFLYTDGVTDVKNFYGEHYGLERTLELLNTITGSSPADVIKGINDGISEFGGKTERFDDTTMMCVAFRGTEN